MSRKMERNQNQPLPPPIEVIHVFLAALVEDPTAVRGCGGRRDGTDVRLDTITSLASKHGQKRWPACLVCWWPDCASVDLANGFTNAYRPIELAT